MWKVLQSVPRGIRNGIATYARRNSCFEEEKDTSCLNNHQRHAAVAVRNYSDRGDRQEDRRFRAHDDCWSHMRRKHTLLEALGWGAAFTAGIVASRPVLFDVGRGEEPRRSHILLECAAAMPIGESDVDDDSSTVRTRRVNRSDSGFSEVRPLEGLQLANREDAYESSVSSSAPQSDSEYSWDSSSSTQEATNVISGQESRERHLLLESLNALTFDEVTKPSEASGTSQRRNDFGSFRFDVDVTARDVASTNDVEEQDKAEVDESRTETTTPRSFAEAVGQFEELCREAYGRHCNHSGIRALKKSDVLKAVHHWMRASGVGYVKGHYNLGRCYEEGIGTYKDLEEAKYYYGLAAAQGHAVAGERLSRLVTTETGSRLLRRLSSAEMSVVCNSGDDSGPSH